jgi:hypothetical protein
VTALAREMAGHVRESATSAVFSVSALVTALLGWAGSAWADTLGVTL